MGVTGSRIRIAIDTSSSEGDSPSNQRGRLNLSFGHFKLYILKQICYISFLRDDFWYS